MFSELRDLSYEERLRECGLTTHSNKQIVNSVRKYLLLSAVSSTFLAGPPKHSHVIVSGFCYEVNRL